MGLSDDQKAMLRLLAQREEGYDDIAALMGLSVGEVRAKVKDALESLEDSGQGAFEPPPQEPSPPPSTPNPQPAKPSSATGKPQKPSPKPSPSSPKSTAMGIPRLSVPKDPGTRLAIVAGLGVTLVLVLLLVTGVLGGGDDSSESTTASTDNAPTEASELASGTKQPTQAVLKAVDGSNGKGAALFGRAGREVLMAFHADGLAPTASGESYVISLSRSPTERGPIAAAKVDDSGEINEQFKVSPESIGLLASGFDEMEVSLVSNAKLRSALEQAKKTGSVPAYSGTAVLRGQVEGPAVEAVAKTQR
jgi:outer membrane biosynthesis protein TonB